MDESRKQFERYIKLRGMSAMKRDGAYVESATRFAFDIWKASRAAIEVSLPEPHAHLIWIQAGYAPDDYWDDVEVSRSEQDKCCDGSERYAVYAEHDVVKLIESAGIKVKK